MNEFETADNWQKINDSIELDPEEINEYKK